MKIGSLQIRNGLFEGQQFRFLHSATIGREETNTIQLFDPLVSRTHARMEYTPEGFRIKDLKSKNGVYINGAKQESALLIPGDILYLGTTEIRFSHSDILGDREDTSAVNISAQRGVLPPLWAEFNKQSLSMMPATEIRRRLEAVLRVNRAIGNEPELRKALEKILEEIFHIVPAKRGAVLAINEETGRLAVICCRSRNGSIDANDINISQTILNKVIEESVGILVHDVLSDHEFSLSESICSENIRSALCVPFLREKEIIGILYLDVSDQAHAFSERDLDLLMAVTGPASVQIQNSLYMTQLRESYRDTIKVLANAVDARDPYTIGHNWRVSRLAVAVASSLGWSEEALRRVELGGILHDIGKIGLADSILLKKEALDQEQRHIMQRHPEIGARIIRGINFLQSVIPFILYHHERWDGTGYPYGLKGAEIPKEGRLLAICDAFDAMTTTRPYRKAMKLDEAIQELVKNERIQFDPNFVKAFAETWETVKITDLLEDIGGEHMWLESLQTHSQYRASL